MPPPLKPLDDRLRRSLYKDAGYKAFPFHAYDDYGNIILPGEVQLPPDEKDKLDKALAAPMWETVYSRLSSLDDPDRWNCYSAAVNYAGESINLIAAKSLDTVPNPKAGRDWCEAFGASLLRSVQQAAGREWAVDHQTVAALKSILSALRKQLSGGGGGSVPAPAPAEPGGGGKPPQPDPASPINPKGPIDVAALSPIMALDFLAGLADFAMTATQPRRITALVLWYVPEGWPIRASRDLLKEWEEFERAENIWEGVRRVESCIWNPGAREVAGWKGPYYYLEGRPPMHLGPLNAHQFFYPAGRNGQWEGGGDE